MARVPEDANEDAKLWFGQRWSPEHKDCAQLGSGSGGGDRVRRTSLHSLRRVLEVTHDDDDDDDDDDGDADANADADGDA